MLNLEGVILSDYLLLECISRGKVADVYRACQNDAGHTEVAVKIFQPAYAEREAFRAYFMYESEKIGQFDHPHILPLIEYGEGEKLLYSLTPFMKHGTLEDLLKKVGGRLSALQTLPIVQQLCDAVQYAHEHDVIHGNIKPGNVFITNHGSMLLADFGIVRSYADGQQPLANLDWGSAEYAAPEQSLGLLRRSSDIYALGALFFRMLTGSPLFTGQTPVEVLLKHVRQQPPSARFLDGSISEASDAVLQKALSKHSDDRYASAAELGMAFTHTISPAPVAAPVTRSLNFTTHRLTSPLHDPQTPLPAVAPATSQVDQTSVVALPPALLPGPIMSSSLPEQHGFPLPTSAEPDIAQMETQAQEKLPDSYLVRQAQPEVKTPPALTSVSPYAANQPLISPSPNAYSGAKQGPGPSEKAKQESNKLLLPILIVILLIIGLLGALFSSFLFPPSPANSGLHTLPALVASHANSMHLWRRK